MASTVTVLLSANKNCMYTGSLSEGLTLTNLRLSSMAIVSGSLILKYAYLESIFFIPTILLLNMYNAFE